MLLLFDDLLLPIGIGILDDIEYVEIFRGVDDIAALASTKVVYAEIIRNAHRPLRKLALVLVLALAQRADDLYKHILKDVIRHLVILDKEKNRRVNSVFVPTEELLKCALITL